MHSEMYTGWAVLLPETETLHRRFALAKSGNAHPFFIGSTREEAEEFVKDLDGCDIKRAHAVKVVIMMHAQTSSLK